VLELALSETRGVYLIFLYEKCIIKTNRCKARYYYLISKKIKIDNPVGLHSKRASLFVNEANRFQSEIFITKGQRRVNAKSIMGVIILSVDLGDEILLEISGDDEEAAMNSIVELLDSDFGLGGEA